MTKQEILNRINILEDEIQTNEEENMTMEYELNYLYRNLQTGNYDEEGFST